jgi:hypothetical protein
MIRTLNVRAVGALVLLAGIWGITAPGVVLAQKKQRDLITREEILASAQKDADLYSAVRSLRPHFLAPPRGTRTLGMERNTAGGYVQGAGAKVPDALLYVNENRLGDISGLKNILAGDTYEVRYLDPAKAEERFGVDAMGGAVLVTLVKGIKSTPPPALE